MRCAVGHAVVKHISMTRHIDIIKKLVTMHALKLEGTRCDVLRRWLLLVFDLLWYVYIVWGRESHLC